MARINARVVRRSLALRGLQQRVLTLTLPLTLPLPLTLTLTLT